MFRFKFNTVILVPAGLIILSFFLSGCQSTRTDQNNSKLFEWEYSDLKLIDPIDKVAPDQDLIAVYARKNVHSFQVRLDFLSLDKYLGKDIYIPIDTNPGAGVQIITENDGDLESDINWDYLLIITESGEIELIDSYFSKLDSAQIFIIYDSAQDRIIIDISRCNLPILFGQTKLQVLITPPGRDDITNKSRPFSFDTPSPARSKVVFAFWNTFISNTPAQVLRSWDGAHAGPMSSRHGLKYLIEAAARTHSTIYLLDLLTPNNISALDYIKVLPRIRELADKGILGLPAIGFNGELFGVKSGLNIGLAGNIADDLANIIIRNNSNFYLLWNYYNIENNMNLKFCCNVYAQYNNQQNCEFSTFIKHSEISLGVLSLECKKLLVTFAYEQSKSPLILGGDFSNSTLGDPDLSAEVFSYIAEHPWIQLLSIQDLSTQDDLFLGDIPSDQNITASEVENIQQPDLEATSTTSKIQEKVFSALLQSPMNRLTALAWQVYYSLVEPGSPALLSLRRNYIGQIGFIINAAEWAEDPKYTQSCSLDLDFDGVNECVLANDQIFVAIEKDGGYIPFIFAKDAQGIHQILGPTWEFIVGLGDPSSWDSKLGVRSDPSQVLGAFQDQNNVWNTYNDNMSDGKTELFTDHTAMRKSVTIYPDRIHVEIMNSKPSEISPFIPLVIDPWQRYTPHWGDSYSGSELPSGYKWGINGGEIVEVYSTNKIDAYAFNETRMSLFKPEDPNFDYLRGHYLPFPMALIEFASPEIISVDLVINLK